MTTVPRFRGGDIQFPVSADAQGNTPKINIRGINNAIGDDAVVEGDGAFAHGQGCRAIGTNTNASGYFSQATNTNAQAHGVGIFESGLNSWAMGGVNIPGIAGDDNGVYARGAVQAWTSTLTFADVVDINVTAGQLRPDNVFVLAGAIAAPTQLVLPLVADCYFYIVESNAKTSVVGLSFRIVVFTQNVASNWVINGAPGGWTLSAGSNTIATGAAAEIIFTYTSNTTGTYVVLPYGAVAAAAPANQGNYIYPYKYNGALSTTTQATQKARMSGWKLIDVTQSFAIVPGTSISGICYNPNQDTLLVINNAGDGTIYEVTIDGATLVRTITLAVALNDPESICWKTGTTFAIAHNESGGANTSNIIEITLPNGNANINLLAASATITPNPAITSASNKGLEGLTYNPDLNVYYCVSEGDNSVGVNPNANTRFIKMNMNGTWSEPFSVSTLFTTANGNQMSDLADCHYDRNQGTVLLLSEQSHRVLEVWPEAIGSFTAGQVVGRIEGPECVNPAGSLVPPFVPFTTGGAFQYEGIAMTPDGQHLFMAGEARTFAHFVRQENWAPQYTEELYHRPRWQHAWVSRGAPPFTAGTSITTNKITTSLVGEIYVSTANGGPATIGPTDIMGGTCTIPADFRTVGKVLKLRAMGFYTCTLGAGVSFRVLLGATVLGTTSSLFPPGSAGTMWEFECLITTRTIDVVGPTTGTLICQGIGHFYDSAGTAQHVCLTSTAVTTLTTTSAHNLILDCTVTGTASITSTNVIVSVSN